MALDIISYSLGKNSTSKDIVWNEPIIRNWDFTNPLNTRGNTTYKNTNSNTYLDTINGWRAAGGTEVNIVTGGINIKFFDGYNHDLTNLYCNFPLFDSYFLDKTATLSVLIDNKLYSTTFTFTSGSGRKVNLITDTMSLFLDRASSVYGVGFCHDGSGDNSLVQGIKLELGNVSTLTYQKGSTYILRKHQNLDEEAWLLSRIASFN